MYQVVVERSAEKDLKRLSPEIRDVQARSANGRGLWVFPSSRSVGL
jgi:mRNA-degrading endonuclease RelE of RelBE toxin-antitoxin system